VSELEDVIEKVPTEASASPLRCARGAWGETSIPSDYLSASVLFHTLFAAGTGGRHQRFARNGE